MTANKNDLDSFENQAQPVDKEKTAAFWNAFYSESDYTGAITSSVLADALNYFGNLDGKSLLEIGCGPGGSAFFFASKGANVVGIDLSTSAINSLTTVCAERGISNVRGICGSVLELDGLEPVDFIFGSMILHHIEPFDRLARQLRRLLKPGGKAFFYENNAASRTLVWFRQNIIGHLWIPKYGDPEEFPLTPQEVDELRRYFRVEAIYPEMLFFSLASTYLLKGRFGKSLSALDRFFYRKRWLLRYSYRQCLLIQG